MLLTIDQAANLLAVSAQTVRREIAAGKLPVVQIRGAPRIDDGDISAYISAHKVRRPQPCLSTSVAIGGMSAYK